MSERVKLVVLGGSALATPVLMEAMGRADAALGYDVVLWGRDEERLHLVTEVGRQVVATYPRLDAVVRASTSLEEAVEGADFCLNQLRIGGLEGRLFDETFPSEFGVPGEETVGPGGFSNARRGIPVVLEVCRTLERAAPKAVILNLTNPSSMIQLAIRKYTAMRVIGTCDSPVSLMTLIASAVSLRREDMEFDAGGMHHFTWIVSARHKGLERLPETLRDPMVAEKLGIDAALLSCLGAIPSPYMRYYLHPNRALAKAAGKPPRAQVLIGLQEAMLADFRTRPAGKMPGSLQRRGAVWYEAIVVPTLLALAEKRDGELILSVDNDATYPWLPPQAIIEAPVPIIAGIPQRPRAAVLPVDVSGMVLSNCAYETLAVEAIVEGDRGKAMRALMSNRMVSGYDQAHGLLVAFWP
jgi:6-phospho-beta-glucosidase